MEKNTILKIENLEVSINENQILKGLNLEHIIVETNQIAKAVVDEVLYCRLDNK